MITGRSSSPVLQSVAFRPYLCIKSDDAVREMARIGSVGKLGKLLSGAVPSRLGQSLTVNFLEKWDKFHLECDQAIKRFEKSIFFAVLKIIGKKCMPQIMLYY